MPTLTKINLLVYLAVWRRPEITELCFSGLDRIRKHPAYNIICLAVISEPSMIPLCEAHNIKWVMHQNFPLGQKKNYGLKTAMFEKFDYMLEIGSDDLVTNQMMDHYLDSFGKHEFFGISDVAYIESESGVCRRLTNKSTTYGAGRMISRRVLEQCNWNLWTNSINRGLDNDSMRRIEKHGFKFHKLEPMQEPGLIDVKSNENLWKFNYFLGVPYNKEKIYELLSQPEINYLNQLQNAGS